MKRNHKDIERKERKTVKWQRVQKSKIDSSEETVVKSAHHSFGQKIFSFLISPSGVASIFLFFNLFVIFDCFASGNFSPPNSLLKLFPSPSSEEIFSKRPVNIKENDLRKEKGVNAGLTTSKKRPWNVFDSETSQKDVSDDSAGKKQNKVCSNPILRIFNQDCRRARRAKRKRGNSSS